MKISVDFPEGVIPQEFAKYAKDSAGVFPLKSFPFTVSDLPEGTKTLAWTLIDLDSIPVCGFAYIHWVVANVPADQTVIPADFARLDDQHDRGINSTYSPLWPERAPELKQAYIGPCPPDQDHVYTLTVYALDAALDLDEDFYLNQLLHAAEGHVLAKAKIDLVGKS